MNVQEMETAARLHVPITVIVWKDNQYGLISWKQDNSFDRHTDLSFSNPNWMRLAAGFGWNGYRVEKSINLRWVLKTAIADRKPTLLTLPIDYRENALLTGQLGEIEMRI